MPNIDERVVSMQFDNSEFDPNLKKSQKTFEEFEKSLSFDKGSKALKNFEKNMDNFDTKSMANKLGALGKSFSAFETVTVGALLSVGNRLENFMNKALRMTLTEGATKGWGDYAEKVTAVQTIMAATASQFEDTATQISVVNGQLDDLRTFADETSFSFKDMTSNIGKFTSQGIDLRTSVRAMEGISTWAALSGANTWEASRAYYNLSQALGTGAVTLIDWKSIENANMATVEFKQTALDTAVALGTLKKQADGTYKTLQGHAVSVANFNQNLSDRWLTSKVLLKSLDRYGGFAKEILEYTNELSGISVRQAMRWIDDYAEGTLDLDNVLKSVGDDSERVEEMITKLGAKEYDLGRRAFRAAQETKTFAEALNYTKEAVATGWSQTWELIFGDYTEARKFWTDITDDLYEIFVTGGEFRNEVLELWSKTVGRKDFVDGINALRDTFYTLRDAVREGIEVVFPFYKDANAVANVLVNLTKRFKEWTISLKANEEQQQKIKNVVSDVSRLLKFAITVLRSIKLIYAPIIDETKQLLKVFKPLFSAIHSGIQDLTESKNVLFAIRVAFYYIGKALALPIKLVNAFINLLRKLSGMKLPELKTYFSDLGKRILTVLGNFAKSVATAGFNIVKGFWTGFSTAWRSVSKAISTAFSLLVDQVKRILKIHSPSRVFENIGSNTGLGFFNGINKAWGQGANQLSLNFEALVEIFKSNTGFADRFAAALRIIGSTLVWLIKIVYQVVKAFLLLRMIITIVTAVTRLFSGIGRMAEVIPDFIENVGEAIYKFGKAASMRALAEFIKSVAISIALLVAAFVVLANIKLRDVQQAIVIMTYLFFMVTAFIAASVGLLRLLGNQAARSLASLAISVIAFSVAMMALTITLNLIIKLIKKAQYNYEIIYRAIGILAAIIVISIGMVALLNLVLKGFDKKIKQITRTMIIISLDISLFFASLLLMGHIFGLVMKALPNVIGAFAAFITLVLVITALSKKVAKKSILKGVLALLFITSAIQIFFASVLLMTAIGRLISITSLMHAGIILTLSIMLISVLAKLAEVGTKEVIANGLLKLIGTVSLVNVFLIITALVVALSALISINALTYSAMVLALSILLFTAIGELTAIANKVKLSNIAKLIALTFGILAFVAVSAMLMGLLSTMKNVSGNLVTLTYLSVTLTLVFLLFGMLAASLKALKISVTSIMAVAVVMTAILIVISIMANVLKKLSTIEGLDKATDVLIKMSFLLVILLGVFAGLAAILAATGIGTAALLSVAFVLIALAVAFTVIADSIPKFVAGMTLFTAWLAEFFKISGKMLLSAFMFYAFSAILLFGSALFTGAVLLLGISIAVFVGILALATVALGLFTGICIIIANNAEKICAAMETLIKAFTMSGFYLAVANMALFGLSALVLGIGSAVLAVGLLLLAPALMLLNLALPAFQNFVEFMRNFIGWDLVGKAGEFLVFSGIMAISAMLLSAVPVLFIALAASIFLLSLSFKYIGKNFEIITKGLSIFNIASGKFVGQAALFSLAMGILALGLGLLAMPLLAVTLGVSSLIRAIANLLNAISRLVDQSDKLESFFKAFSDNIHYVVAGVVALGASLGNISPPLMSFGDAISRIAWAVFGLSLSLVVLGVALAVIAIGFGLIVLMLFLFEKVLDDIKDKHPRLYEAIMDIVEALSQAIKKSFEAPQSFEDSGKRFVEVLSNFTRDIEMVAHGVAMAVEGLGALVQGLGEGLGAALKGAGEGLGKWLSGSKKEREQLIELARVQTDLSNAQARNSEATAKVVTETNKLNDTLSKLPSSGSGNKVFAFLEKLAEKIKELGDVCKTYYVSISNARSNINSFFKQLSENAINEYINVLTKANARVKIAAQEVGMNCARGLNLGLKNNTPLAASAASALGSATIAALRKSVDAHSPARKFEEIGGDEIDGNVDGINKNKYKVVSAAEGMGDAVVSASKSVADRIVEAYEEAFNTIELRAKKTRFDELDKKLKTKGQTLTNEEWGEYFRLQNDISLLNANKKYLELSKDAREEEKARVKAERRAKNEEKEAKSFKETLSAVGTDLKDIVSAVKNGDATIGEAFSRGWNSIKSNFGGYLGDKFSGIFSGDILSKIKKTLGLDNIFGGAGLDLESLMPKTEDITDPYAGIDTNFGSGTDLSGIDNVSGTGQGTINTYEFVQNNYSPKALSRIEIYRQTNRQFNNFRTREVLAR